jgi:hypothetical protein
MYFVRFTQKIIYFHEILNLRHCKGYGVCYVSNQRIRMRTNVR